MSLRADAHLHFFSPGYVAQLAENCRRIQPDEVTLYSALAQQHDIAQVLAVGYEGQAWAVGNNHYLATLAATHDWIRPVAYAEPAQLDLALLQQYAQQRFVGLSCYLFDEAQLAALAQVPDQVWDWLVDRHWLISVNSRGTCWEHWQPILTRHPQLRLLVSHLGLPPIRQQPPTPAEANAALSSVLSLASFPGVHVKLSGFYALTDPGYDYPHRAAWPYVEALIAGFGVERLLWASDFSPSLEWVSFPQTFALLSQMPFLSTADRQRIEGANLLALLAGLE